MRHMIYSKVSYFLFIMNTSLSRLKIFLTVGKVNLRTLVSLKIQYQSTSIEIFLWVTSCYSQEMTPRKKSKPESGTILHRISQAQKLLTKVTRTVREQYYDNILESSIGNSKKLWSNINTILGKNCLSPSTSI